MGAIDLANLVFPETIDDTRLDIITRKYLYEIGLDYSHGTGHGIGSFLNVHESNYSKRRSTLMIFLCFCDNFSFYGDFYTGPTQIRISGKESHLFKPNFFFSDGKSETNKMQIF